MSVDCLGQVSAKHFKWTASDQKHSYTSSSAATRTFCGNCGSNISLVYNSDPDTVWVAAGCFDFFPASRPNKHIYVKDRADWFSITDYLPRHPGS